MNLLQEYYFVSLDIFKKNMENKTVQTKLEAWLSFLSFDEPERIIDLISVYPEFKDMYQEIYRLCLNTERVMEVCSMELRELDRNTVLYMIDEMQEQIAEMSETLLQKKEEVAQQNEMLEQQNEMLEQQNEMLEQQNEMLEQQNEMLEQQKTEIELRDQRIRELEALLAARE